MLAGMTKERTKKVGYGIVLVWLLIAALLFIGTLTRTVEFRRDGQMVATRSENALVSLAWPGFVLSAAVGMHVVHLVRS